MRGLRSNWDQMRSWELSWRDGICKKRKRSPACCICSAWLCNVLYARLPCSKEVPSNTAKCQHCTLAFVRPQNHEQNEFLFFISYIWVFWDSKRKCYLSPSVFYNQTKTHETLLFLFVFLFFFKLSCNKVKMYILSIPKVKGNSASNWKAYSLQYNYQSVWDFSFKMKYKEGFFPTTLKTFEIIFKIKVRHVVSDSDVASTGFQWSTWMNVMNLHFPGRSPFLRQIQTPNKDFVANSSYIAWKLAKKANWIQKHRYVLWAECRGVGLTSKLHCLSERTTSGLEI